MNTNLIVRTVPIHMTIHSDIFKHRPRNRLIHYVEITFWIKWPEVEVYRALGIDNRFKKGVQIFSANFCGRCRYIYRMNRCVVTFVVCAIFQLVSFSSSAIGRGSRCALISRICAQVIYCSDRRFHVLRFSRGCGSCRWGGFRGR